MTPERFEQIGRLFQAALDRDRAERAVFLDQECGGDSDLRREVESLIASHEKANSFFPSSFPFPASPSMVGRTLGRYQLLAPLGAGGMGEVYRAQDLRLGREVAVKILPAVLSQRPEAVSRFEREAKAVAALSHQNILSIYDFGNEEGVSYAVMELLTGETLRDCLRRSPPPLSKALEIAGAIAEGLAAAHAKEIVHRDLKPENVFLTSEGQTKILDFGLARSGLPVADERTLTSGKPSDTIPGTVMGTRGYMSPEQIRGQVAGAPSDIFSLGCILQEMLSGKAPFSRPTPGETSNATLNEDPPLLTSSGVPKGLQAAVRRCLKRDPGDRFASAGELARELKLIAKNEESKKRRRVLQAAGAAITVLLLGLGAASWFYFRPTHRQSGAVDSLAVLPLDNFSSDPEQGYFADGMTEELITNLAKIRALRVISRTSVMKYKGVRKSLPEIARELNVIGVVEGSVQRVGDRVRITAQLIHAPTESHLWAESYERDLRDVLALQSDVAQAIAREIKIRLTNEEKTRLASPRKVQPKAYQAYLLGLQAYNIGTPEGFRKSVEYFREATQTDPQYARAYARLAVSFTAMAYSDLALVKQAMPEASRWALKALELDPSMAEAHVALASVRMTDWDWEGARTELKDALALDPNSATAHTTYANYLAAMGRQEEAVEEGKRARELDPVPIQRTVNLASFYQFARRYDQAAAELRRVLEIHPSAALANESLGINYLLQQKSEKAIEVLEKARDPENRGSPDTLIAIAYAKLRNGAEARKLTSEIVEAMKKAPKPKYVSPTEVALIYGELGEKDEAFVWLEKAYQEHDPWLLYVKLSPLMDPLRSDPRHHDLLRRMGLPP